MAALTLKIASGILAAVTGFSGANGDFGMTLTDEPKPPIVKVQSSLESSAGVAESSGAQVGMVVTDRADTNKTYIAGDKAHLPVESPGFTQLLMALNVYANHPGDIEKMRTAVSPMIQIASSDSTDRVWSKYGRDASIAKISDRYKLEEVENSGDWHKVKISPVDMNRALRGFFNDKDISWKTKRDLFGVMKKPSPDITGTSMSWGFQGSENASTGTPGIKQSFILSGGGHAPYRGSIIITDDTRFIGVTSMNWGKEKPDNDANDVISRSVDSVWSGGIPVDDKEVPDYLKETFKERVKAGDKAIGYTR